MDFVESQSSPTRLLWSMSYYCDDRRIVAHAKSRSKKNISIYKCQQCTWTVKFVKEHGRVAKHDAWYLADGSPSQPHDVGCRPVEILKRSDILRNSLDLQLFLSENRNADRNAVETFMRTQDIDICQMGKGPFYNARNNIVGLLDMDDMEINSIFSGGRSASSSEVIRRLLSNPSEGRAQPSTAAAFTQQAVVQASITTSRTAQIQEQASDNWDSKDLVVARLVTPKWNPPEPPNPGRGQKGGSAPSATSSVYDVGSTCGITDDNLQDVFGKRCTPDDDLDDILQESLISFASSRRPNRSTESSSQNQSNVSTADRGNSRGAIAVAENNKRDRSGATVHSTEPTKVKSRLLDSTPGNSLASYMTDMMDEACSNWRQRLAISSWQSRSTPSVPSAPVGFLKELLGKSLGKTSQEMQNTEGRTVRFFPVLGKDLRVPNYLHGENSTVSGLGHIGTVSAETAICKLDNQILDVYDAKRLLDELADQAINSDGYILRETTKAIRVVSDVMERHAPDKGVQQSAFAVLRCLCGSTDTIEVPCDVIEHTLHMIVSSSTDPEFVRDGWWMLRVVVHSDQRVKSLFGGRSGIESILNCMHQFSSLATIQGEGLDLLAKLATANPENQRKIVATDGIHLALRAMRQHDQEDGVQDAGCCLLGHLIVCDPRKNQLLIARASGIDTILNGMRQHQQRDQVQSWGCFALGHLSLQNCENQNTIASAKGINTILSGMREHTQNDQVLLWGCFALRCLSLRNAENQSAVTDANGIAVLVEAMRVYRQHPGIQARGRFALMQLTEPNDLQMYGLISGPVTCGILRSVYTKGYTE